MGPTHDLKLGTIEGWLESDSWVLRIAAERLKECSDPIRLSTIECGLLAQNETIATDAASACRGRTDIPLKVIKHWAKSNNPHHRLAALEAATDRPDVPLSIIRRGLTESVAHLRKTAARACRGRKDIPLATIKEWAQDDDWHVRLAAMEAASHRQDVPYSLIEAGLEDSLSVRAAAKRAAAFRGQIFRSFEPTGPVYGKCLENVVVVAEIPSDAHIVGAPGRECRSSKAVVTDIIGRVGGERVAISPYEHIKIYHIGEKVDAQDFDFAEIGPGTGFHFFNTLQEARS